MDCIEVYGLLCRASELGLTIVYSCARGRYNDVDFRDFTSLQMSRDDDDEVLTIRRSFHNEYILVQSIHHNKIVLHNKDTTIMLVYVVPFITSTYLYSQFIIIK